MAAAAAAAAPEYDRQAYATRSSELDLAPFRPIFAAFCKFRGLCSACIKPLGDEMGLSCQCLPACARLHKECAFKFQGMFPRCASLVVESAARCLLSLSSRWATCRNGGSGGGCTCNELRLSPRDVLESRMEKIPYGGVYHDYNASEYIETMHELFMQLAVFAPVYGMEMPRTPTGDYFLGRTEFSDPMIVMNELEFLLPSLRPIVASYADSGVKNDIAMQGRVYLRQLLDMQEDDADRALMRNNHRQPRSFACGECGKLGHLTEKCWTMMRCGKCDERGHRTAQCRTMMRCGKCGEHGHRTEQCWADV